MGTLGLLSFESPGKVEVKKGDRSLLEELDTSAIADSDDLSLVLLL